MSGTEDSRTAVTKPSADSEPATKPAKTFAEWWMALVSGLAAVGGVVVVFIKVTPLEVDGLRTLTAVALLGGAFLLTGYVVWGRRHGGHRWRRTAILGSAALLPLIGGVGLLFTGTKDAASPGAGTSHNNATSVTSGPTTSIPAGDTVRYAGDFRLDASHESVDLDLNPPRAYGVVNELAVGDNEIWMVPPAAKAALWSVPKPAIRQQCADTVTTANPAPEYFDTPQPGLSFCVLTSDERYAFVQVKSAESKNYNLSVVVWEK